MTLEELRSACTSIILHNTLRQIVNQGKGLLQNLREDFLLLSPKKRLKMEPSKKRRPLQAIAKLFHKSHGGKKGNKCDSVQQVHHATTTQSKEHVSGKNKLDCWNFLAFPHSSIQISHYQPGVDYTNIFRASCFVPGKLLSTQKSLFYCIMS